MRISDWSSDVCSSDLPVTAGEVLLHHRQRLLAALQAARQLARAPRRIHRRPAADEACDRDVGFMAVLLEEHPSQRLRTLPRVAGEVRKIGRASCRESACPYA